MGHRPDSHRRQRPLRPAPRRLGRVADANGTRFGRKRAGSNNLRQLPARPAERQNAVRNRRLYAGAPGRAAAKRLSAGHRGRRTRQKTAPPERLGRQAASRRRVQTASRSRRARRRQQTRAKPAEKSRRRTRRGGRAPVAAGRGKSPVRCHAGAYAQSRSRRRATRFSGCPKRAGGRQTAGGRVFRRRDGDGGRPRREAKPPQPAQPTGAADERRGGYCVVGGGNRMMWLAKSLNALTEPPKISDSIF